MATLRMRQIAQRSTEGRSSSQVVAARSPGRGLVPQKVVNNAGIAWHAAADPQFTTADPLVRREEDSAVDAGEIQRHHGRVALVRKEVPHKPRASRSAVRSVQFRAGRRIERVKVEPVASCKEEALDFNKLFAAWNHQSQELRASSGAIGGPKFSSIFREGGKYNPRAENGEVCKD